MATHQAAICLAKGQPFEVQSRPTPKPGPGELLIAVAAIALNPADHIMRELGLFIPSYPTVLGFDISGLVLELGEGVPQTASKGDTQTRFQPGVTRVAAYAAFAWSSGNADYGAFQEKCIVPWQHAVPLPDRELSWVEAATFPVAVQVPLSAWDAMGIERPSQAKNAPALEKHPDTATHEPKKEVLLIWGASSSVGTMGVQTARLLCQDPNSPFAAVYATAGASNQEYVRALGADRVSDHKDPRVVESIASSAKGDGLVIRHCFLAMGDVTLCQGVLKAFLGDDAKAKIVSAPPVPVDAEVVDGLDVTFVQPSADTEERLAQFHYWLGTWLPDNLARKTITPSPRPRVVGTGLEAINGGLDILRQGVSCTKLVVSLEQ